MSAPGFLNLVIALSLALIVSNVTMLLLMGRGPEVHKRFSSVLDACGCNSPHLKEQVARLLCNPAFRDAQTPSEPTYAGYPHAQVPYHPPKHPLLPYDDCYEMPASWVRPPPAFRAFVDEVPTPLVAQTQRSVVPQVTASPQTAPKMSPTSALGKNVNIYHFN